MCRRLRDTSKTRCHEAEKRRETVIRGGHCFPRCCRAALLCQLLQEQGLTDKLPVQLGGVMPSSPLARKHAQVAITYAADACGGSCAMGLLT
jgi:hypothetical protein